MQRHGRPSRADGMPYDPNFAIVGYGGVGGLEFGHGSDLDLVFIHDGDPHCETGGGKSIDSAQFFTRLGQRIIHFLTTQTPSSTLYEADMRLRLSGAVGLLVSSLGAFQRYQEQEAWTWGYQALIHTRVLTGCRRVQASSEVVRAEVLARSRGLDALRTEVSEMCAKMRDNLGTCAIAAGTAPNAFEATAAFGLKHDAGGIVDTEFMVQYAVLAWPGERPALFEFTDNIRILEGLKRAGLIASEDVHFLQGAYKAYRVVAHCLALQRETGVVSDKHLQMERREVIGIWRELRLG